MRLEIKKLQRRLETAAIYVTHDQVEAMTLADRIVVLNNGEVEQIGTPNEVYTNPASTFVAGFIGAPPMNLVKAEAREDGIAIGDQVLPAHTPHRGPVTLGLRPERANLSESGVGLSIKVSVVEELGANRLIHGHVGDTEFTVAQDAELPVPTGTMTLGFKPEDTHLFDPGSGRRL